MAVATKQLGFGNPVTTGTLNLYVVPGGKRSIVKSLVVRNLTGSAVIASFTVHGGGTDKGYFRVYVAAAGTDGDTKILEPWLVLEAADTLQVATVSGSVSVIASGAELTL